MTEPASIPAHAGCGGHRACGDRQPGGAYLCLPLGPGGSPVEDFLIDPPIEIDSQALGLSPVGVTLLARDGVTHVLDIIGREHYPTVEAFVDEVRRMGVSRRIAITTDFARLTNGSRLLTLHDHAHIANAAEFPTDRPCPTRNPDHDAHHPVMCARLWPDEPLAAALHRCAIFASFPIGRIEVVRDPAGNTHHHAHNAASRARGIDVLEVGQ